MSSDAAVKVDGRTARGAATRRALLDAAIEILMEDGYAGATTSRISERAGVSPGLFARYWPSKTALIADAAAHAQRRGFRYLADRFVGLAGTDMGRQVAALRLMFQAFSETEMRLLGELQVAARTDDALRAALAEVLQDSVAFMVGGARSLAREDQRTDDFEDRLLALVDQARGLALRTASMPEKEARAAREAALAIAMDVFDLHG